MGPVACDTGVQVKLLAAILFSMLFEPIDKSFPCAAGAVCLTGDEVIDIDMFRLGKLLPKQKTGYAEDINTFLDVGNAVAVFLL